MPSRNDIMLLNKKLEQVKMMILNQNPFYGILLLKLPCKITKEDYLIATDGEAIYFGLNHMTEAAQLSLDELTFLITHELTHLVLNHQNRRKYVTNKEAFDYAADMVVNSFIYKDSGNNPFSVIYQGKTMPHQLSDGTEASEYSVDQLYMMILAQMEKEQQKQGDGEGSSSNESENSNSESDGKGDSSESDQEGSGGGSFYKPMPDSHDKFQGDSDNTDFQAEMMAAADACRAKAQGTLPLGARLVLEQLKAPKIDWKEVLKDFLSFSIEDYTFTPPDRRFDEYDFFLPGYNNEEATMENILFLIDASGSMSIEEISKIFAMIKETLTQFDGHVSGKLAFFDAKLFDIYSFENEEELSSIRPKGGGGTDFAHVLREVREECQDNLPKAIVVLTDGYGGEVREEDCPDIPVLWLLDNKEVEEPAIGRSIRVNLDDLKAD